MFEKTKGVITGRNTMAGWCLRKSQQISGHLRKSNSVTFHQIMMKTIKRQRIAPYMEATEPSVPILLVKFKSSLRKCYDRQDDLVDRYGISVSQMICLIHRKHFSVLSSFMTYHRVCNQINTTVPIGTTNPSEALGCTTGFQCGSCYLIFGFMCSVLQIVICPF